MNLIKTTKPEASYIEFKCRRCSAAFWQSSAVEEAPKSCPHCGKNPRSWMLAAKVKNAFTTVFWTIAAILQILLVIAFYLFIAGAGIVIPVLFFIWVCRKLFGWF